MGVVDGVVAGVAAGVETVPPERGLPDPSANPVVDPNCGGVTDKTAPSPVTVPPAIKKKRLVSIGFSLNQLREIQILRCGSDREEYRRHARPCERFPPTLLGHIYKHQRHQRLGLTW